MRPASQKKAEPKGKTSPTSYFKGGLFADIDLIDLLPAELDLLATAADSNRAMIKLEIFGTLFQSSMDSDERHAFGAHFTSEFDIRKVVGPTIVRPWRDKMEAGMMSKRIVCTMTAIGLVMGTIYHTVMPLFD